MPVWLAWMSPRTPMRSSRASWSPRKSTGAAPLVRSPGARSTTVTAYPDSPSQYASEAPAMPPPEMSTDLVMGSSWCPLGLGAATIQVVYPLGQSIWINQLVDTSVRIDAMGNREDLLAGALECLKTRGWGRT